MSKALRATKCFKRSLRWAGQMRPPGAAPHHVGAPGARIDLAHRLAAAGRAQLRHPVGLGTAGALVEDDAHDLRDHIAGAAHDHGVADAGVLARDLVLVVERGVGDDDAAHRHRLELGGGRQRAGAAYVDHDVEEPGGGFLGGELVRDGPARGARDEAQPLLPVELVDLVDDAVDVVAEPGTPLRHLAMEGQHVLDAGAHPHQRVDRQAPAPEDMDHVPLRLCRQRACGTPGISEKAQRPACGDRRIELPQRACRSVSRVGEHLAPGRGLLFVQRLEVGVREVDLAAHLDTLGHALAAQPVRDLADRHDVGRDVLALLPVAARGGQREPPRLVGERDRQPVDLGLGHRLDLGIRPKPQEPAHAGDEVGDLLLGEGVAKRQHRHGVAHLAERLDGRGPDAPGRAVRPPQGGKRASIASLRRRSSSYSASEISGASWR
jgi:hypothetical protein